MRARWAFGASGGAFSAASGWGRARAGRGRPYRRPIAGRARARRSAIAGAALVIALACVERGWMSIGRLGRGRSVVESGGLGAFRRRERDEKTDLGRSFECHANRLSSPAR